MVARRLVLRFLALCLPLISFRFGCSWEDEEGERECQRQGLRDGDHDVLSSGGSMSVAGDYMRGKIAWRIGGALA